MAQRSALIAELVCVVALLVVYRATMAPSLTWANHGADGGDLVTAVARGSIPHPPGFPTYLLSGGLFIRLPWGEPAWRLNLMSAVFAAGAAGLTVVTVRRLLRLGTCEPQTAILGLQSAVCVGLSIGLAPLFWSQALITEVYTLEAFFTALVVALALGGGPMWALGLAWGVGLGIHPTLVCLAPMVVWGVQFDREKRLRRLIQVGLIALLGLGTMYGPVLIARGGVPSPWCDVKTLAGWWALVSGRLYHGYLFALPLPAWPRRILAWTGLLARQFTPLGAILTGVGWVHLWREYRSLALASMLCFGAFSLYAVSYNTADSLVYLVAGLPLAALWLGMGLIWSAGWVGDRLKGGAWIILLMPLLQALLFWGKVDLSNDRTPREWAAQVLQQAPPRAVLLTARDAHTFTLWYVHDVLGERPDVVVIDQDLWAHRPYRELVSRSLGLEAIESNLVPADAAHRTGRPIVELMTSDQ